MISDNPHFSQFAALLSVAQTANWRSRHPEVPSVRGTIGQLIKSLKGGSGFSQSFRHAFLSKFLVLIVDVVSHDPKLFYREEDFLWLIELMDDEDAGHVKETLSWLFATASARDSWFSAEEVAKATGKAESTLRNDAAAGRFIGARKVGNSWMFRGTALRAYGMKIERSAASEDEIVEDG